MVFPKVVIPMSLALSFLVSFNWICVAQERAKTYFEIYKGDVQVPPELKRRYADFVTTIDKKDPKPALADFCLPYAVRVELAPRKEGKEWNIRDELNVPFLRSHRFTPNVKTVIKKSDDVYMVCTDSTSIGFVLTKSNEWKIFYTIDQNIQ